LARGIFASQIVAGAAPAHVGLDEGEIDAITIFDGYVHERIEKRLGEEVGLETQVDELGVLGVVIVLLGFDARIGHVIDFDFEAHFAGGGLDELSNFEN